MIGVYLMGVPGSGKSTLLRAVLPIPLGLSVKPFPHLLYGTAERIVGTQLGAYHPDFPGTDRLSMGIQAQAIAYTKAAPFPVLLGEGDRLTTEPYLRVLLDSTDETTILWLDAAPELALRRCRSRGSAQNPRWIAGRRTKVTRLAYVFGPHVTRLDAALPLDALIAQALAASKGLRLLAALGEPLGLPSNFRPVTAD